MEIKYNTPIEVSKEKYDLLMDKASGIVAGRVENGKHYVKVMIMKYSNYVLNLLK